MKEIKLTKGFVTQVDDEDYEWLNQYSWYAQKKGTNWYAVRQVRTRTYYEDGRERYAIVKMHRLILGLTDKSKLVDHADRNGLNNQRSNLRITDHFGNNKNAIKKVKGTSIYKGVSWSKIRQKWRVSIKSDNKCIEIGFFNNEEEAAKQYDAHAKILHKEFACLNFPETKNP